MKSTIKSSFRSQLIHIKTINLLESKTNSPRGKETVKYRQIEASLRSIGLIEPLVVFPASNNKYRVLDGHKRLEILKRRGSLEVECLIATSDDSYTYNRRVNYLSTVSEHKMILRALRHNSEETIATALDVDVSVIRRKRDLLNGICAESVEILKDRRVAPRAFAILRKMKPVRQVEVAELMVASNKYSGLYAAALLAGTRSEMLLKCETGENSAASVAKKERLLSETDTLLRTVRAVQASYGTDVLALTVSCRYIEKVLANACCTQYLGLKFPAILNQLDLVTQFFHQEIDLAVPASRKH